MQNILDYAPWLIVAIVFFHQYKVFMTPVDFEKEKSVFIKYLTDKFVLKESCIANNKYIQDKLSITSQSIKDNIDAIKNEIKEDIKELKDIIMNKYQK